MINNCSIYRDQRVIHEKILLKKIISHEPSPSQQQEVYPLVYLLLKLALLLPVTTAIVQRETKLRNKMGDQWMNDCLVTFIEKEVFCSVPNDFIIRQIQDLKTSRNRI